MGRGGRRGRRDEEADDYYWEWNTMKSPKRLHPTFQSSDAAWLSH